MGGPGSGRLLRFNTKPKVERQTYIDIRWMKRENLFHSWNYRNIVLVIVMETIEGRLILR